MESTNKNNILHRQEFRYSGHGLLAEQERYENGTLVHTVHLVRDGMLAIQDRNASNAVLREYTWGLNLGGGIGGLLNLNSAGQNYAYLYDGNGNVHAVLNAAQQVVAAYRYDPFGVLLAKTGSFEQPYGFSTKRTDPRTGLVFYEYRPYDPSSGRWFTRDPLGEAGGLNLYAFVGNNPVNWVDPWGLETIAIITTDYLFLVPFGSHATLYINHDGNPVLYDPAGSYTEGDVLTGGMADLTRYVNYQIAAGSKVSRLYFDTTHEEEAAILERIFEAPTAAPGMCAIAVSGVLNDIGPFEELGIRLLPGSLYRALRKLQ